MNLGSVIALAKSIIMNVVRDLEWPSVYDSGNTSPFFGKVRIAYLPKLFFQSYETVNVYPYLFI